MTSGGAGGVLAALGRHLGLGRRRDTREPGAFNHISLGSNCQMAHALKTLDLRTWSAPFDWLFTLPEMVSDCLADDFAALTDRGQLESIPEAERLGPGITRGRHRLYRARYGLECVFNHHDPAASDADYAFLAEGVRRLRQALSAEGTRNRFWLMSHLHIVPETVEAICDGLARQPSRNHLTVLQLLPGHPALRLVETDEPRPDLRRLTVACASAPVGLRLADPAEDAALLEIVGREASRVPAQLA
ncbi:DUF1796 family putative cysteine peptidase [Methylobacterium dankookense]|uniref:DUF1796 family putative cysteine peptidase n=1 Tax=Methylobacterium dankookense TaxID=560405 RepID=UPI0011A848E4|nr:DUF1796 family putative cysteine peptidase [Methylobacterium dankookense]